MRRRWIGVIVVSAAVGVPSGAGAVAIPGAPACPVFPADSYWHASVAAMPVDPNSGAYVANAGAAAGLHADFGAGLYGGGPIGIPFTTVPGTQPKVPIGFDYADESDPGPYPIPANAPIEGGSASTGDRHVIVVDRDHCRLYEMYSSYPSGSGWTAGSGAVFDLTANAMRPRTWTSADAAGLPILPGLVRYDEVAGGTIDHAIRITLRRTDRRYVWPARHQAGVADPTAAPMGAWLRLKANIDPNRFGPQARVVVRALQTHGAIVADNGSSWYISGAPDDRWDNDDLHGLGALHGSDFEFIDPTAMMVGPDTGQVVTAPARSDLAGGVTLDGFGGLHRFRVGAGPVLGAIREGPYWRGLGHCSRGRNHPERGGRLRARRIRGSALVPDRGVDDVGPSGDRRPVLAGLGHRSGRGRAPRRIWWLRARRFRRAPPVPTRCRADATDRDERPVLAGLGYCSGRGPPAGRSNGISGRRARRTPPGGVRGYGGAPLGSRPLRDPRRGAHRRPRAPAGRHRRVHVGSTRWRAPLRGGTDESRGTDRGRRAGLAVADRPRDCRLAEHAGLTTRARTSRDRRSPCRNSRRDVPTRLATRGVRPVDSGRARAARVR